MTVIAFKTQKNNYIPLDLSCKQTKLTVCLQSVFLIKMHCATVDQQNTLKPTAGIQSVLSHLHAWEAGYV